MSERPDIETGVAYARSGPSGITKIRFVVAVGGDAAPVGHELYGEPTVKFRRVSSTTVHRPEYLKLEAFMKWRAAAYVDPEATRKARDHLGYGCGRL